MRARKKVDGIAGGGANGARRGAVVLWLAGLVVALAAAPDPVAAQQPPRSEDCIGCHLDLDEERLVEPARAYPADIHAERGFTCLACHGAVPAGHQGGAKDPSMGFIARPTKAQIPELCGSCHSDIQFMKAYNPSLRVDQLAEYRTSGHGQALAAGDTAVATCVSCHPAHSILPPSNPESSVYPTRVAELCGSCHSDPELMEPRGLPMDALAEYRTSVHGRAMLEGEDLSAPTCNDCHGNHGATPPGVADVERVCGQCHSRLADYFEASGHELPFREAGMPGCAACHGNHAIQQPTDADLAVRADVVCSRCHEADDSATLAFPTMLALIDSLQAEREEAKALLERAENLGMEVSQAQFELEEVTNAITQGRSAIHTFSVPEVLALIDDGLEVVERSEDRGLSALWEHRYRRMGLAASAGIIILLIVGLLLKIREIEARPATAPAAAPGDTTPTRA